MKSLQATIEKHQIKDLTITYWKLLWLWIQDNSEEMSPLEFVTWNKILANARKGEQAE